MSWKQINRRYVNDDHPNEDAGSCSTNRRVHQCASPLPGSKDPNAVDPTTVDLTGWQAKRAQPRGTADARDRPARARENQIPPHVLIESRMR
jgi:hypothetical protein